MASVDELALASSFNNLAFSRAGQTRRSSAVKSRAGGGVAEL